MPQVLVFLSPPADSPQENRFGIYKPVEFSRVPCVGEFVSVSKDHDDYQVVSVVHTTPVLNPHVVAEVYAVKVKNWKKVLEAAAESARKQIG